MADTATLDRDRTVAVATAKSPKVVQGRRAFFKYHDLGVTDGSKGHMRAQITRAEQGMSQPTGWHYHICESQFVYVLKGWLELEFEDGPVRLETGDSIYIPGGTPHNESRTADAFEILEVSVPAEMQTKACEPPARRG